MGERTAARPVASGRVAAPRALEFGVVLMALSFALLATTVNVLTAAAGARRRALLRRRLHGLPQALDRPEHRHRRRRRRRAAARRLRRRDREPGAAGALAVPDRLPLDAAALLGARADDQGALRRGERADAAGHAGRPRDDAADPALLARAGGVHRRASAGGSARSTPSPRCSSARTSSCSRGSSAATPRAAAPSCCSTTRSRTWRCSSWRPRSIPLLV